MDTTSNFREFFKDVLKSSIVDEYSESFRVGADPSTLSEDARVVYDQAYDRLKRRDSSNGVPSCGELFQTTFKGLTKRLDVKGSTREQAGERYLTKEQQEFFGTYGVLPAIPLPSVPSELLTSVDQLCSALVKHPAGGVNGLSSTPAWIFDRDLLSLIMHPEIVEKVSSLIGDELTFLGSDGPMYLPPNSPNKTAWHAFDAEHFGGGGSDGNLQLVSVWVALADANVANGCMKIAPGSFRAFDALNRVAPRFYGASINELIEELVQGPSRVEPEIAAQIVCRRLNDTNFPALLRLGSTASSPEGYRYNPFHSAVDRTWCIGAQQLNMLDEYPKVALEAKRGDAFFFTSQNAHASFQNTTSGWRKAIAFRYVKTANASKSVITHASQRMRTFLDLFPRAPELLRTLNRSIDSFDEAAPRLCVKGRIPVGQEAFYFEPKTLDAALAGLGGSCLTRIDPLPTVG